MPARPACERDGECIIGLNEEGTPSCTIALPSGASATSDAAHSVITELCNPSVPVCALLNLPPEIKYILIMKHTLQLQPQKATGHFNCWWRHK